MGRAMVGAVLLAAGFLGGCAATQAPGSMPVASVMPESRMPAAAPAGFLSFCIRFAGQCDPAPRPATAVPLNEQTWRTIARVNSNVNDSIWPQDDIDHYGRAEYWTIPDDGYGDCDDYAVTKRKDLLAAGFPSSALRLAVVITPSAARHAVLTVSTDKGDLVLDNMTSAIVPWNATGFTWIERQDAANPRNWVSLRPQLARASELPTATADRH